MRSEKEIREKLDKMKSVNLVVHPSQILFTDWILEQGNEKDQKIYFEILDGIVDAHKRAHPE